jgi:hypothetical protein
MKTQADACFSFILKEVYNKVPGLRLELQVQKILFASLDSILFSHMEMLSNVNPKPCQDDKRSAYRAH